MGMSHLANASHVDGDQRHLRKGDLRDPIEAAEISIVSSVLAIGHGPQNKELPQRKDTLLQKPG